MRDRRPTDKNDESLLTLVGQLPGILSNLVKAEIANAKTQLAHKGKYAGIGAAFVAGAAVFLFFAVGVLVAVAILALALVLPAWLAALIVFVLFVVIAGILVLIGLRFFKKINEDPSPIDNVKEDIKAVKGVGEYDR
ncbi:MULTISPECIES: phage holin family protein [unclassified Plantibacter]|uniref:phage holin family protein n=1 Tax=unclassified Plantibacter TaxID=2624265 RepID=UPI003D332FDB